MLMVLLRLAFIALGLIFLSEIPSSEKVFFNARFAFYGMLVLDFINIYKSNQGFEKHYAGIGLSITGIITFCDLLGILDIIILDKGIISANEKYTLLSWVPNISVDAYIVSFSLVTVFFCAAELILIYVRNKMKSKAVGSEETVLDT
ncbi:hypothetical protein [Bacillus infantis]|uniref:hypothetical protein n=1 Tax=Bacillus infantis TaxID=324767 RepID=UPI003CEEDD37